MTNPRAATVTLGLLFFVYSGAHFEGRILGSMAAKEIPN